MAIFGLRARPLGQTNYHSLPDDSSIGEYAIIEVAQAITIAQIISGPLRCLRGSREEDLPGIIRMATESDIQTHQKNQELSRRAFGFCSKRIRDRRMDMKLVDVEVFFDRSKLVFYFTAPTRIDFRELVKDLVREYRSRIELRQIGVRHETQMLGAIGNCGLVCCCRQYLRKFAPVTIRMAKDQNLFLNPAKISGICGRLLCCLSYEQDNYEQFHNDAPRVGRKYRTKKGIFKIIRTSMFSDSVTVQNEANEEIEFSLDEWHALEPMIPPGEAKYYHDYHDRNDNDEISEADLSRLENDNFSD